MKLEPKLYTTRDQKVGDFMLGVGLFVAGNIVLAVVFGVLASLISAFVPSTLSGTAGTNSIGTLLTLFVSFIPFVINIALMIYFGLTRRWVALGMLAAFAIILVVVLILGAACFALIAGISGSNP
jgi:hypothetical protein